MKTLLLLTLLPLGGYAQTFEDFARAIHKVETGGRIGPIIGDNGRARGPLQIHRVCWLDVKDKIKGEYADVSGLEYSIKVLCAYCERYESKALKANDFESLARLWNSGPGWRGKREKTNLYWSKVQKHLTIGAK